MAIGDIVDANGNVIKPAQTTQGGGGGGGDDSAANAFGYGMVSAVPFGKTIGAALETGAGYVLPKSMMGPGYVDQTGEGWAQRYAENRARIGATDKSLRAAHPFIYTGASIAPMLAAPEVGGLELATAKGAGLYGAAQGASEASDDPDAGWGTYATKMGLGAATGAGGAWAMNKILPVAGDAGRSALLAAAKRLSQQSGGVDVTMPSFAASTSPLWQKMGVWGASTPVMQLPIEKAAHESIAGLGAAAEQTAAGATKLSAGKAASASLQDWIGNTSKKPVDAAYNRVAQSVNQSTTTPLNSTLNSASQIFQRRQAAGLSGNGGAVDHVMDALMRPGGLTYGGIKDLRSSVREMMDQSILPQGMSGTELKQVYDGLTDDLESAAFNAGGQQGLADHQAANKLASDTAAKRAQLTQLLGGPQAGSSDEAVFGALKRAAGKTDTADLKLLQQASNAIPPQSWDEVSRGMVSTLGRDADGNFSPARYLSDWGKFSDDAKDVLFKQNTQLRQNLDDLATVSSKWKTLGKLANVSASAGHAAGMAAMFEGARHPLKALALGLPAYGLGKLLATPAGAGAAGNFVTAVSSGRPELIRQAAMRVSAAASAQLGARVDPMALAALAMERPWEGEGKENQGASGNVPQ
jgi:hypothetical protein